jgi:putative colanic acid biosynthesis UDP-glucose lipid carrier transferase
MTEPVIFKRSVSIAILALVRAVAPALVAIGMLYALASVFGKGFGNHFVMLAVLLFILGPIIQQPPGIASLQIGLHRWPMVVGIMVRWAILLALLLAIGYVTKFSDAFSRRVLLTWAILTPLPLIVVLLALDSALRRLMLSTSNIRSAVFAGYNDVSIALAQRLRQHPEMCIAVDGFFDDRSSERLGVLDGGERMLGRLSELAPYVNRQRTDVIFVALPMRHVQRVLDLLDELRDTTASIYYVPDVFVIDLIQSRTGDILGMPVVAMCETPFSGYRGVVKRLMDLCLSSVGLLLLLPFLVVVSILVKLSSPGPVIFKQRRYGLDGREIYIYKFRTMIVTEDGDQVRQATRNDQRVTAVGRILRRFSIDELPQLVNVIRGNMSLVGPRPHAVAHNEEYRKLIKGYMVRHKVLPGITGLAQINGCRGETTKLDEMRARIEYDLEYLRHWSPGLDLKILLNTVVQLVGDRKAY